VEISFTIPREHLREARAALAEETYSEPIAYEEMGKVSIVGGGAGLVGLSSASKCS
jgi:hypothetical protein